jgi:hypothetical protein
MTNRESEQRIVPLTPGNAGRGKALSPTRDLAACPGRGLLAWPLGLENSNISNARHIDHVCE